MSRSDEGQWSLHPICDRQVRYNYPSSSVYLPHCENKVRFRVSPILQQHFTLCPKPIPSGKTLLSRRSRSACNLFSSLMSSAHSKSQCSLSEKISMSLFSRDRTNFITTSMKRSEIKCEKGQQWRTWLDVIELWWKIVICTKSGSVVRIRRLRWNKSHWYTLQCDKVPQNCAIDCVQCSFTIQKKQKYWIYWRFAYVATAVV